MNQGTTEILLALGLADRTIGTAYLDDEIWQEFAEEYAKIPVLSETYPDAKQIQALQPDFLYASYSSAFATSHVNYTDSFLEECTLVIQRHDGENRTHCRQELHDEGINTYLQEPFCERLEDRPEKIGIDVLFNEIWDIATIFDALEEGRDLITTMELQFEQAQALTSSSAGDGRPLRVLWLDSISENGNPFVGVCCGAVQTILELGGALNVFADYGVEDRLSWDEVTWEDVAATDPDLIVVVDASWDSIGTYTCAL